MHSDSRSVLSGYSMAFVGAIAFSGKAIVAKLLYRQGIDAVAALALRMLLAWPFFIAMAWWGGRGKPGLQARDWLRVMSLGFTGYYLASALDFLGLQYISASLERLILFVYPTIVALIAAVRGHKGITRGQATALGVSYAGVLLAFGHEAVLSLQHPGSHVLWGSVLVFGGAVSYAVYLVLGGETVGRFGALRLTGLASGVACALCVAQFCVLNPWQAWAQFSPPVWKLSVINAAACTVLPMWMVMRAMELIGPAHTAQVGMIGPVSTLILAVWLLGEPFTFPLLVGTALVLAGVALLARQKTAPGAIKSPAIATQAAAGGQGSPGL
jgi:drug/metabolite transporter (DMT)-like permease